MLLVRDALVRGVLVDQQQRVAVARPECTCARVARARACRGRSPHRHRDDSDCEQRSARSSAGVDRSEERPRTRDERACRCSRESVAAACAWSVAAHRAAHCVEDLVAEAQAYVALGRMHVRIDVIGRQFEKHDAVRMPPGHGKRRVSRAPCARSCSALRNSRPLTKSSCMRRSGAIRIPAR